MVEDGVATLPVLVFDLDGTLTDSKPGILSCLQATLEAYGLVAIGPLDRFVGPPVEDWALELLPNGSQMDRAAFARHYRACYDRSGWSNNSVFPGVRAALSELFACGLPLYVCTSKQEHFAIRILEEFRLSSHFSGIYGDKLEYAVHGKTHLLNMLLCENSLANQDVWMVGDRIHDFHAARENGIKSVAVGWGYGTPAEFERADQFVEKPGDLLTLFT